MLNSLNSQHMEFIKLLDSKVDKYQGIKGTVLYSDNILKNNFDNLNNALADLSKALDESNDTISK